MANDREFVEMGGGMAEREREGVETTQVEMPDKSRAGRAWEILLRVPDWSGVKQVQPTPPVWAESFHFYTDGRMSIVESNAISFKEKKYVKNHYQ